MANECVPYFAGAKQITFLAGTGGIGGKRFVAGTGALAVGLGTDGGVPTGVIAGAGVDVAGVGAQDAAVGVSGGVFVHGIVPVIAGAALTAGPVMSNASGQAIPWTTGSQIAGNCLASAASGADAMIELAS